jgi:putative chitinase
MPKLQQPELLAKILNTELPKAGIDSKLRLAAFIAQCGHESSDFNILEENLNYSAKRLREVFPKYFPTDEIASRYDRKAVAIANRVYANRMGNGNESSGDGYKYRGRGVIMLTGKDMYDKFSFSLEGNKKFVLNPDLLLTPVYAVQSAIWFWSDYKNLNLLADKSDMVSMTKAINGGQIGLDDRIKRYKMALSAIG